MALPQIQHQSQPHLSPETVFVQVMWLQPWFFSVAAPHFGQGFVISASDALSFFACSRWAISYCRQLCPRWALLCTRQKEWLHFWQVISG